MIRSRIVNVSKQESFDIIPIGITTAALVAIVAAFVISREGNLQWDDTEYLYTGLEMAQWTELNGTLKGIWKPLRAIYNTIYISTKPPLLHAWIAQSWLLFGDCSIMPVLVFSAVIPFGLLALGVVSVAWRLFGSRAALLSLVCLGASPGMLGIASCVFVETFLSLWILLIFYSMAILIDRPSSASALLLGTALAMALLTKLTIPLLLTGAALYFLYAYLRHHPIGAASRVIACAVLPVIVLAGPWYLKNGRSAVQHAFFSAGFNAFTGSAITPRGQRIIQILECVCGWPLCLVVIAVGLWSYFLRRGSMMLPDGSGRTFIKVTTSGFALGAAILLLPSYFETRFLLPAWPAMAIVIGAVLQGLISESRPWRSAVTASVLAIGLGWSIASLANCPRTVTYWNLGGIIQKLVTDHGVGTLGILGNTADWNFYKVRLINDLRNGRQGRFGVSDLEILDLSRGSPDGVDWYDLRLMSTVSDVNGISTKGKNQIVVATVNRVLHFRIFDGDGKVVVDTDEKRLTEQARPIEDLRKQLESLWPPHVLTTSEKGRLITAVTSIVVQPYVEHELDRIDALAMLERSQISDQELRKAPRMNRGYASIDEALRKRAEQFVEVGADSNIPPRFRVYVRRRVSEPSL